MNKYRGISCILWLRLAIGFDPQCTGGSRSLDAEAIDTNPYGS